MGFACVKHDASGLGNDLKPAANQYPKRFMVNDAVHNFRNDWEKNVDGQSGANFPNSKAVRL
jgi:hypothetical protein